MSFTEWPPTEVLIPSLPNDVALNILARVPRQFHPVLSAVSKPIRSAVSSPHFFTLRSLLNVTETLLYLKVRAFRGIYEYDHWFAVHRNPNPTNNNLLKFAPVPRIPIENELRFSAYVAVGPKVYVIGGEYLINSERDREPSSDVWILDCRSHTWERGPSMRSPRNFPSAAVVDGKIYAVGGSSRSRLWAEVLDPAVGRWEYIPCPLDGTYPEVFKFKLVDGNISIWLTSSFASDPKGFRLDTTTKTWEVFETEFSSNTNICVVDGVSYTSFGNNVGKIERFDERIGVWKELKGVEEGKPEYVYGDVQTLINLDGRLVVVFAEMRFEDTTDLKMGMGKAGLWCAEIDVTENGDGDWWGRVHWSEKVLLLPEVTWETPDVFAFFYISERLLVSL
ncbi:F-box/kelch-repeat protein SKIP6 [Morus notabilis]|uniref:F-box/kelch-repeat protein SKIP6 n=1 Tax=Morus notabilis TaxID=981085 RepID=W9SAK0_9ROSA|nr:F-box/kelch-repeat protein SKIP6 [Morus notabilis]XP_024029355.1 F-box/kelch-repeat protein SKIP6 [Morus notabilis]XP_024029356.1 F-box/kelch-repeat protein SKIP6 [Morus notabilis]EXC19717.1 F-box/kelch-repeat protein SKIP6 [Morus notabilis]